MLSRFRHCRALGRSLAYRQPPGAQGGLLHNALARSGQRGDDTWKESACGFRTVSLLTSAAAAGLAASRAQLSCEGAEDISISSTFDSGNIEVVKASANSADLKIKREPFTEGTDEKQHFQWFYFRASHVGGKTVSFRIVNAAQASYAPGWKGYRACCSYDRETWFRVPTSYNEKTGLMTINVKPGQDTIWIAYFAPFSYEQHQALVARCVQAPDTRVRSIGKSLDGREIDLVETGTGKLQVWITCRQHPGESQAEFWAEGFLRRLLDPRDPKACKLKKLCTFHVVPNMNPDGSVRGHLRTNACGANLNREWGPTGDLYEAPTMERSPEVVSALREMDKTGVDFFCDVHADEEMPHTFFAGTHGVACWNDRLAWLHQTLAEAYNAANPDFGNLLYNYGNDQLGEADMRCADAVVAQRFKCLSVTLEQPFKDCYDNQQPEFGWSPARCRELGASMLDALDAVVGDLRRDFKVDPSKVKPWNVPGYPCPPATECTWQ